MMFRCEICAADSIYHYYGVQSCEGCKQFFRRIIVKQKDFKCWKTQKCNIEKGERCRSCRLDKCLMMGMNPRMVNIRKTPQLEHFVGLMEKRRLNLFENIRSSKTQNEGDETGKMSATKFMAEITSPKPFATSTTPPNQLEMATASMSPKMEPNAFDAINSLQQNLGIYPQTPSISATSMAFQPIAPPITDTSNISFKMLDSLLIMENCLKRIWYSGTELPASYIDRHPDLPTFLQDSRNLLTQASQFSTSTSQTVAKNTIIEKAEEHGFYFPEHINSVVKDRFLAIEMAKTMPFFSKLSTEDQVALLRHIMGPVTMFINAFYSYQMGAETWTRSNGFMNIALFNQSKLQNDEKIMLLSKQMLCDSVDGFKKADIGREEFVMLMSILFASSTANNLSQAARELLYEESTRYSKALLDILQMKHGHIPGSQKYAVVIELLSQAFHFNYRMHLLDTYTSVMYTFDHMTIFPKVLENSPLRDP